MSTQPAAEELIPNFDICPNCLHRFTVHHLYEDSWSMHCSLCDCKYKLPLHIQRETVPDSYFSHPSYYGGDTQYEAIKVIQAWDLNFTLGNVLKYIRRAGQKPNVESIDDLRKAREYLDMEIAHRDRTG